jgi:hypothetical protein
MVGSEEYPAACPEGSILELAEELCFIDRTIPRALSLLPSSACRESEYDSGNKSCTLSLKKVMTLHSGEIAPKHWKWIIQYNSRARSMRYISACSH